MYSELLELLAKVGGERRNLLERFFEPSAEERALTMESLLAIDSLLDGLSPRARTAFLCSQLDGMKYADIADLLDVSTIRVRQYVAKGLKLCCRELLES